MSDNIERLLGSIDERTQIIQKNVKDIYIKLDTVQSDTDKNTVGVSWLKKGLLSIFGIIGGLFVWAVRSILLK